jgi:hypothetical protein
MHVTHCVWRQDGGQEGGEAAFEGGGLCPQAAEQVPSPTGQETHGGAASREAAAHGRGVRHQTAGEFVTMITLTVAIPIHPHSRLSIYIDALE